MLNFLILFGMGFAMGFGVRSRYYGVTAGCCLEGFLTVRIPHPALPFSDVDFMLAGLPRVTLAVRANPWEVKASAVDATGRDIHTCSPSVGEKLKRPVLSSLQQRDHLPTLRTRYPNNSTITKSSNAQSNSGQAEPLCALPGAVPEKSSVLDASDGEPAPPPPPLRGLPERGAHTFRSLDTTYADR